LLVRQSYSLIDRIDWKVCRRAQNACQKAAGNNKGADGPKVRSYPTGRAIFTDRYQFTCMLAFTASLSTLKSRLLRPDSALTLTVLL
jgi:hypothetical protein